jgi:hypothetical protein
MTGLMYFESSEFLGCRATELGPQQSGMMFDVKFREQGHFLQGCLTDRGMFDQIFFKDIISQLFQFAA